MANPYPLPKFHFSISWRNKDIAHFTEVSGLTVETEIIEFRDGASKEFHKMKIPGMKKFSNITLKRGVFPGKNEFFKWWDELSLEEIPEETLTIKLLDEQGEPKVTWEVKSPWPVKVQSTDLKSDDNGVAIETIELAHQGFTIKHENV